MSEIGYGYGSECHLLRFLGRHRTCLDTSILRKVGGEAIAWLDFPFDERKAWHDGERKGLDFLPPNSQAVIAWRDFWPQRGNPPNWDAVGKVLRNGQEEWLLVEAKAHLGELRSSCQAKPEGGRDTIIAALTETKFALGVPTERDWLNGYYQYCNRIAVLSLLTRCEVPARLLFLYFTGDRFPDDPKVECPQSEAEWADALADQSCHVGLPKGHVLEDRIHKLFLDVRGERNGEGES